MSSVPLTTFPPAEMIAHARAHASFYRDLYAGLPATPALTDLPVIDQEQFWQAHQEDRQSVLTGPLDNGIVLNSGGTTGAPKYSYFNDADWHSMIALSAKTYEATGLRDGDRVANLFASGNLYASFLFATESLKWTRPKVMQFPLGFSPNLAPAAAIIHAFKTNVLAGFPTHLLRMIEHLDQEKMTGVHLDRIIYGGELFSKDQQTFLEGRFPGIRIRSAGYASVDAGLIGYADEGCAAGEHRVFDGAMVMEIVDEATGEPIEDVGQPGRVVFTSLVRRLMPLLRYPSGDRAHWVEPLGSADRRFQLLGRSEEAARIASFNVEVSGITKMLETFKEPYRIGAFQLLVTRENLRDRLTFRLTSDAPQEVLASGAAEILKAFEAHRPDIYGPVRLGSIHAPEVEWVTTDQLTVSERTGKLLRVVDRRNQ